MAQIHAFISYVRENKGLVDRLAVELQAVGAKIWLDRNDIAPGRNWKQAIREAIRTGAFFIACFSRELNDREESVMHGELRDAIDILRNMPPNRVWLIPVFLNETKIPDHFISGHEYLSDINAVKLYEDWNLGIRKILQAMNLDDPSYREALHLVDLVKHHVPERAHALERLKALSSRPDIVSFASPAVIEVLGEADHIVCRRAVEVLTGFGSAAVPPLNEALRSADAIVRGRAALVLSNIGPVSADAIRALIEALHDVNREVSLRTTMALVTMGQADIDAALRDADDKVRKHAVEALEEVGIKTDRKGKLPSDGWLLWENGTHVLIHEGGAMEHKVYKKRPGRSWDDNWSKDYFIWSFAYDEDGTPVCVGRTRCSPD